MKKQIFKNVVTLIIALIASTVKYLQSDWLRGVQFISYCTRSIAFQKLLLKKFRLKTLKENYVKGKLYPIIRCKNKCRNV